VLGELRARHPETVIIAEAYWDMEWELQEQGFSFCYDKRLYDRIIGQDAAAIREHLRADLSDQSRLVRFLEASCAALAAADAVIINDRRSGGTIVTEYERGDPLPSDATTRR
jgi:hypothetical protein